MLVLTRSEIEKLLSTAGFLDALRTAFEAYSTQRTVGAMRVPLQSPRDLVPPGASGMLVAQGLVPGIPTYSVKVHAKFPGSEPAIRGVLILHALSTGEPLAVMESSYLTPLRTGLAGALGCDVLALAGATRVAIIGAGVHGRAQLSASRLVRPIESVRVLDTSPEAIERFRRDPACAGLEVTSATSLEDVLDNVHIAIAARGEPAFSVSPSSTRGPPQHRAWRGSTREVRSRGGRVGEGVGCCGRQELAVQMGAIGGQVWAWNRYTPDWGEVIAGIKSGREDEDQITLFGSVRLAFQDLAPGGSLTLSLLSGNSAAGLVSSTRPNEFPR